jgi:tetratricopeptide (TPR) repeat protein
MAGPGVNVVTPAQASLVLLAVPHLLQGGQRHDLPSNVPGHLLAYLALRGDWVTREALAALFWPERSEPEAQHNLRVNLHRLKKLLDGWGLAGQLHSEMRRMRVALPCDVHTLRQAAGRGDDATVLALHQQPLLSGLSLGGFAAVQEWLLIERAGLQDLVDVATARQAQRAAPPALPATSAPPVSSTPSAPPAPSLAPARLAHPPWVGRADTLAALAGSPAPLLVVAGEPGVGKSRLLAQACPGAVWLSCPAGRNQQPLAALAEYLQDMQDSLPQLPGWPALALELSALVPALAPGVLPAPQGAAALPRLVRAGARLLRLSGTTLVVDDLQWADPALLGLLHQLLAEGGVAVRATLRPGEATADLQDWLAVHGAQMLALPPATVQELRDLVASLSGRRLADGPQHFAAWLHGHCGGNLYFALEILRALFDAGRLHQGEGGWSSEIDALTDDYAELALPPRIWGLVDRRLQALPAATRQVLTAAAVAGDARHPELLAAATGLPPLAVAEALTQAQAAAWLRQRVFAHDLVREALLRRLPEATAQVLHAALARHGAGVLPPHRLALHAFAAGQEAQAVEHTLAAALLDCRRGLHAMAANALGAALDRCPTPAQRARLQVGLARTALERLDFDTATERARAALGSLPEPACRVQALVLLADLALQQGRLDDARQWAGDAAVIEPEEAAVLMVQGRLAFEAGDFDGNIAPLQKLLPRQRRESPSEHLVSTLSSLGAAHDAAGRPALGLPFHEEALATARLLGARHSEVDATLNLLWTLPDLGRHEEAIALGRHALTLGDYDGTPFLMNNLAFLYWDLGRLDEAEPLYRRLAEATDPSVRCFAWAKLITLAARRGLAADCHVAIERGLAALEHTQAYRAHAVVVLAVLEAGSPAQAQRALAWLRPQQALDAALQRQLDAALAAPGSAGS